MAKAKRVLTYLLVKVALMCDICANAGTPLETPVVHYNGKALKNAGGYIALISARAVLGDDAGPMHVLDLAQRTINLCGTYHNLKDNTTPISGVSANGKYKASRAYLDPKHMHAERLDTCTVSPTKRAYWYSRIAVYQLVARKADLTTYVQAYNDRLKADKRKGVDGKALRLTAKSLTEAVAKWQKANSANDQRSAKAHA